MSDTLPDTSSRTISDTIAVAVKGLHKEYDRGMVHALAGVDLTVHEGEWVAITGPSGCGKSTLIQLLAALDTPTSGTVQILGQNLATVRNLAQFRRTSVGLVFQLHNLLPQLSAQQNVEVAMFGVTRDRHRRAERARQLLADLDLDGCENRDPTRLSGGERQRVAIARAIANDPPVLLADEPTGSLDTASVTHVIKLVQQLLLDRPELTVVMVTHDPRVAAAADRIVYMQDGQVVPAPA